MYTHYRNGLAHSSHDVQSFKVQQVIELNVFHLLNQMRADGDRAYRKRWTQEINLLAQFHLNVNASRNLSSHRRGGHNYTYAYQKIDVL